MQLAERTTETAAAQRILRTAGFTACRVTEKLASGRFGSVFVVKTSQGPKAAKIVELESSKVIDKATGIPTDPRLTISKDWRVLVEHSSKIQCEEIVDVIAYNKIFSENDDMSSKAYGVIIMEYYPWSLYNYVVTRLPELKGQQDLIRHGLFRRLAEILDILQSNRGLLYTDLKPQNILINDRNFDANGVPVMVMGDLGGFKGIGSSSVNPVETTWDYAAPETLRQGAAPDVVSVLYSLGLVGFFILEGRLPYQDECSYFDRPKRLDEDGPDFSAAGLQRGGAFSHVIARCLRTNRTERYEGFGTVLTALDRAVSDSPTMIRDVNDPGVSISWWSAGQHLASTFWSRFAGLFIGGQSETSAPATRMAPDSSNLDVTGNEREQNKPGMLSLKMERPDGRWVDPFTGLDFLWVPPGRFMAGCERWVNDCRGPATGDREIVVNGFWLSRFPVTQGAWKRIQRKNPSGFPKGDLYPVENISWDDVLLFIQALNRLGPQTFRLPTEAEWEYACRSGGLLQKYAGGKDLENFAWFSANSRMGTNPVGTKEPNDLGFHDMNGNVWEWVVDSWTTPSSSKRVDFRSSIRSKKFNPEDEEFRIKRGGAWGSSQSELCCCSREKVPRKYKHRSLGFRLATDRLL